MHRPVVLALVVTLAAPSAVVAQRSPSRLAPIVGTWQSDTVNGISARSECTLSADGSAVLCDQLVSTPTGIHHVLDLFTADSAPGRAVLYVVNQPGDTLRPLPITIAGPIWTYGGTAPAKDGTWWRTINDFSATDSYTWRAEKSTDGKVWATVMGGRSVRR
jgi:hypothetical protein